MRFLIVRLYKNYVRSYRTNDKEFILMQGICMLYSNPHLHTACITQKLYFQVGGFGPSMTPRPHQATITCLQS